MAKLNGFVSRVLSNIEKHNNITIPQGVQNFIVCGMFNEVKSKYGSGRLPKILPLRYHLMISTVLANTLISRSVLCDVPKFRSLIVSSGSHSHKIKFYGRMCKKVIAELSRLDELESFEKELVRMTYRRQTKKLTLRPGHYLLVLDNYGKYELEIRDIEEPTTIDNLVVFMSSSDPIY